MLIQLNDCTCLGYNQMFECTAFGRGLTIWRGSAFSDCQQNEIRLRHSQYDNNQATGECNGGKIVARSVGFSESGSGRYYTSQLSLAVREGLINETIECIYEDVQGTIIDIIGERILDLIQDGKQCILYTDSAKLNLLSVNLYSTISTTK